MDKIIIKNLLVRGILGIHPHERVNKQDILITLILETDTRAAAASDNIADAINYQTITNQIITHVQESSDNLIERLADSLARLLLSQYPAQRITLRIDKPHALPVAKSVGLEIVRTPEDYR